jgi:hypothetical protein
VSRFLRRNVPAPRGGGRPTAARLRKAVLAACVLLAPVVARATLVEFVPGPYGELVDREPFEVRIHGQGRVFDCGDPLRVERTGRTVRIGVRAGATAPAPPLCATTASAFVPPLAAGPWRFEIVLLDEAGQRVVETVTHERRVVTPGTTCNPYAETGSRVSVQHRTLTATALAAKLGTDAAFRARLGDPIGVFPAVVDPAPGDPFERHATLVYPPLANIFDRQAQVRALEEFSHAAASIQGCLGVPPADRRATVVEFHHAGLDQYFYTWMPEEIAALDAGERIRGWQRTGESFPVLAAPGCRALRPEGVVYRFFGEPGVGPPTHFFTVLRDECKVVDDSRLWRYEGIAFFAEPPDVDAGCAGAGRVAIHRLWRPFGTSTHRYTTNAATVEAMKARGWVDEGVALCAS